MLQQFYGIVIVKIPVFTDELPEVRKDRILAQDCTSNKVVELQSKVRLCSPKVPAFSHDNMKCDELTNGVTAKG